MIERIDHIGVVVRNLEEQIPFYRDVLGLRFGGIETVASQKVRIAVFHVGEVNIELLQPTGPESPVAAFLEKRGEGIHHLAYRVGDLPAAIAHLKARQVEMIDQAPRPGAHGSQVAFLHPRSSGRVLTELTQP
jgi:methylmalonyl-CoA/ethylmalonyl-CoA epimerase